MYTSYNILFELTVTNPLTYLIILFPWYNIVQLYNILLIYYLNNEQFFIIDNDHTTLGIENNYTNMSFENIFLKKIQYVLV